MSLLGSGEEFIPERAELKLPPHSIEAEQGVLGCCLLDPANCIGDCIAAFKGNPAVFYDLRHRAIYEELTLMFDARTAVDIVTLSQRLKDKGQLEGVGGLPALASLPDATPSAANLKHYLDIMVEKFTLRRVIHVCTEAVSKANDTGNKAERILDEVERDILAVCGTGEADTGNRKSSFERVTSLLEEAYTNKGKLVGLGTGLWGIDKILGGLRNGTMNVVAARPGLGKSTLGYGIAEFNAREGTPVGYFSMEMGEDELNLRSLCAASTVNSRDALTGNINERDVARMIGQIKELSKLPIHICDRGDMDILRIRSEGRRMASKLGVKLIVVDYLQLIKGNSRHGRREDVDEISRGIKSMAKELGIPVIALAQLNREIERDAGRRPRLSDLRESGGIEQDADSVSFIYCPDETQIQDNGTLPVKFSTQKNRNGDIGECDLLFERAYTRFTMPSLMGN